ncbi:MAG TPA: nuclear transport factor 2 family protein [Woeseiaceae bacterium]|nr:nuclear transport factor 2 family protein [Woeseiaceae bacterium]
MTLNQRDDDGADPIRRSLLAVTAMAPLLAAAGEESAPGARPAGAGKLPPDLAQAMHDYDQATFSNDIETYRRVVAEDYQLVNSDSSLEDKELSIVPFAEPGFRIDPHVTEEPLQIVWDGGAVLGGRLRLSWTQGGVHHTRVVRRAHVWARRDGRWQLVYTQVTRVPEPAGVPTS